MTTQLVPPPQPPLLQASTLYAKARSIELVKAFEFPEADRNGPRPTYVNVKHFLDAFDITVMWNEFAIDYMVGGVPGSTIMDDVAINKISVTLHRFGLDIAKERLIDFLRDIGQENTIHPLRMIFDELETRWDGQPRLATWLHNFCGVEDNEYTRYVARALLTMQVRRIRQPGFDFKYIPVFEGKQGIGKTPFVKTLAFDRYFNDNLKIGAPSKDVISQSRNVMIHSFGELAGLTKRDVEEFKAFTARTHDRDRLPYAKSDTEIPRHFMFYADSNRQDYNRDETGNDRMLSILCNNDINSDKMLLIDEMRAELPQIYGEAAKFERAATRDDLHPRGNVVTLHRAEQDKRYARDGYFDAIEAALVGVDLTSGAFVPLAELVKACMPEAIVFNACDPRLTKPIAAAMLKMGWTSDRLSCRVKGFGHTAKDDKVVVRKLSGYWKGVRPEGILDTFLMFDPTLGHLVPTMQA